MTRPVSLVFAVFVAGGLLVGAIKLWRRITRPELRVDQHAR